MTKANTFRLISLSFFLCAINIFCLNAAELTTSEKETLAMIAERCRSNRQMLNSFECEYIRSYDTQTAFKGRYAFKNDKVLFYEKIGDTNDYFQYIKNGNKLRVISDSDPKTVVIGTEGNSEVIPPMPDPWEHCGHKHMYKLDKFDSPYDKVSSVESITENGRELIVVKIEQRLNTSPEDQVDNLLTIQFSVNDGYLPVRILQESQNKNDKAPKFVYDSIINKILKFDVNGKTFYLPASLSQNNYRDAQVNYSSEYNIKEESVKINPDLPDDMFEENIEPGDIVVDKDNGIQYRTPAAGVIGVPAPDFTLDVLGSNEKVTLSKVKAKVIVLDFWATWCGPCRKIHPAIEAIHKWAKENNKPVAFYAVDVKEETDTVTEFCKKDSYSMPVLLDTDGSIFKAYKGTGIPYVIIISDGIIQNVLIGSGAEVDVLEEHIKDMIETELDK